MKLEIATLIIRLAIAIMTGICIPAFKHWLDVKAENEKFAQIRQTAETAVYAARFSPLRQLRSYSLPIR